MPLQPDFRDLLAEFAAEAVDYLIVGSHAVVFHGGPRADQSLQLWLDDTPANLARARRALEHFAAPPELLDALAAPPANVLAMGAPPARIELVRGLPGVPFADACARAVRAEWEGVTVAIVGRDDLIALKRSSGQPLDLFDVVALERT